MKNTTLPIEYAHFSRYVDFENGGTTSITGWSLGGGLEVESVDAHLKKL
jgi:hypothetical protein